MSASLDQLNEHVAAVQKRSHVISQSAQIAKQQYDLKKAQFQAVIMPSASQRFCQGLVFGLGLGLGIGLIAAAVGITLLVIA